MWDSGGNRELARASPLAPGPELRVTVRIAVVRWLYLHDVDDRAARIEVEAGGGEECGADVSGEE